MPVYQLNRQIAFPDPRGADEDGIVAVGGDLAPARVLAAYACGIFPWPHEGMPLLWFSPDPRYLLPVGEIKLWRSLRQTLHKRPFRITLDRAFSRVMAGCAQAARKGERGTWITPALRRAFEALHEAGVAHSVEAWTGDELAGGLYGLSLGGMFCGESMFHRRDDASKVAFVALVQQLARWNFDFVDAETYTPHMARYGTRPVPREQFLESLARTLRRETRRGPWVLDDDLPWVPKAGA
ncbi:leucyl/phenylalanyl-tRNA--protein transferase [bacterium]|nr:MAG: leucyl/phenylalanyl-tRNA--protein transferase [bacterium]RIK63749.1 MAG: leucyl/phenylalanyl-tRNA--protein transferase [Planctomycetota bacterium]